MRRKEWLSVFGEEVFVGLNHAFEPRKELFSAVIRMKNDRDAVVFGDRSGVHRKGNRSGDVCIGDLFQRRRIDGHEYTGYRWRFLKRS